MLRIVSIALSITTIGMAAGDGDREPTHTGAISMFMDNHEHVAHASRVGRTAKVSGVDNTETGGATKKMPETRHAQPPEVEAVSNTPTRSRTKLSSGAAALFCV